jgi:hypothetical protein
MVTILQTVRINVQFQTRRSIILLRPENGLDNGGHFPCVWSGVRGKDVPEATKMVTAGIAYLPGFLVNRQTRHFLQAALRPPEEVHDQRNDGDYQQKMNQPTGNVEREKSQQPQYKQYNE